MITQAAGVTLGGDTGRPVERSGDPLILALEAWHLLSTRTRNCLAYRHVEADPPSTVAGVPIERMRLSDLARRDLVKCARIPNLGRVSLCELACVMNRYGWRFHDPFRPEATAFDYQLFTGLPRMLKQIERAADARRKNFERDEAIWRLHEEEGLTARAIGERFAVSSAVAQTAIERIRRLVELRAQYPLEHGPDRQPTPMHELP